MNKSKRNHILIILNHSMKALKSFWVLIVIAFTKSFLIGILSALGLTIVLLFINFIKWLKTTYIIDEGVISYKSGIIQRNSVEIPYNKITTFDINQSLVQRLFKVVSVKIDTGAAHKESELVLFLSEAYGEQLKSLVGQFKDDYVEKSEGNEKKSLDLKNIKTLKADLKDIIFYSLTRNNIAVAIGLLLSAQQFLDDILKAFNINIEEKLEQLGVGLHLFDGSLYNIIFQVLILLIAFTIISTIISSITCIIKFADYSISRDKDRLTINYGIITKKNYTFSIDKINAIVLKQNMLRQLFGLYKIQLSAIGYGDEQKEEAVFYPLCSKKKFEYLIAELLPEFIFSGEIYKVPKEGINRFFILPITLYICISTIVSIIFPKFSFIFLFLIFIIFFCFREYRNSALGYDKHHVYTSSGAIYKQIAIIPIKQLQAFSHKFTYFQRKTGTCNYNFNCFGKPIPFSSKNLKNSYVKKIKEII